MTDTENLTWLLDRFVSQVPEVRYAIVLSQDGLILQHSSGLDRDRADTLAAEASSLKSLSKAVASDFDGGAVENTLVQMQHAFLFVCAAGYGASLAVLTEGDADVAAVAAAMRRLITQVGPYLQTELRPVPDPGAVGER